MATKRRFEAGAQAGHIVDTETGLVWLKPDERLIFFRDIEKHLKKISSAKVKWRLPTVHELVNLIDYSRPGVRTAFPDAPDSCACISSATLPDRGPLAQFWAVDIARGSVYTMYAARESQWRPLFVMDASPAQKRKGNSVKSVKKAAKKSRR